MATTASGWDATAAIYESTIIPITKPTTHELITRINTLHPFSNPNSKAFDNGCGTGIVSRHLSSQFPGLAITATDISPGMITYLKETFKLPNVTALVQDATNLKDLQDEEFSHVLTVGMIGSTPDPLQALKEMYRVCRKGGIAGVASWRCSQWPKVWEAAVRRSMNLPDYVSPHIVDPRTSTKEGLRGLMVEAGWKVEGEVRCFDVCFGWEDSEDAMRYFWNDEFPNPIPNILRQRWGEMELVGIKEVWKEEFERIWPKAGEMGDTAVMAVGWKE